MRAGGKKGKNFLQVKIFSYNMVSKSIYTQERISHPKGGKGLSIYAPDPLGEVY